MITKIKTAPTSEPVTLSDIKTHLRITDADANEDEYINALISAETGRIEAYLNRAVMSQTWYYYLEQWPNTDRFDIPLPPLQSVTSITYKDADGTAATLSSTSSYIVDTASEPGRVVLAYNQTWPFGDLYPSNPITVEYVCGYSSRDNVPRKIRQAMMIEIADLYENRQSIETVRSLNILPTVERLIYDMRMWP